MRLVALFVPVAIVGVFLAYEANGSKHARRVVIHEAPVPTVTVDARVARARAPRVSVSADQSIAIGQDATFEFRADVGAMVSEALEAAVAATAASLENAELSLELTEELLEAVSEMLLEITVSADGELIIETRAGNRVRMTADGNGHLTIETIERSF